MLTPAATEPHPSEARQVEGMTSYPKIAQLKDIGAFRARLVGLGIDLPCDDEILTAEAGSYDEEEASTQTNGW